MSRASEPYYRWIPYRNRSDGSPSWQSKILYNTGKWKGCVACGANRIGKSVTGAYTTALIVTGEHPTYATPKEGIAWVVGLDSKAIAAICKPIFESYLPKRYLETAKWNGKHEYWTFKADGREWQVWYKSVDAGRQKFQGSQIDFAWVDEEPLKEGVFREMELRMLDREAPWLLTATPVEGTQWLKETLDRDDVFWTMAGMRENPYIPMNEIDKIARQMAPDERDVRIEGKYVIFGGRPVFSRDWVAEQEVQALNPTIGNLVA